MVNGVWNKTSVAEGEAIIGEAQEVQEEVGEAAAQIAQEESAAAAIEGPVVLEEHQEEAPAAAEARAEESVAIGTLIEEIPSENILPVVGTSENLNRTTIVASILRDVLESISSTQGEPERFSESVASEVVASGHTDEIIMEKAPRQGEQVVANEKISVEDAPIEGEQSIDEEAAPQGEHTESVPMDNEEHVEFEEHIARAHSKRKRIAHRKPVISRLNVQGKTLSSLQSDIQCLLISQTSAANEIGTLSTEVHSLRDDFKMFKQLCRLMKGEFESVKKLISSREQSSSAPPIPPPANPVSSSGPSQARQQEEEAGPSGPSGIAEDRPSGKIVVELVGPTGPQAVQKEPAGPSGPVKVVSGPTGSVVSEDVQSSVEELAVAPKAPEPSFLATPAPSSPPSSSILPPAPPTFKQHVPRTISSPAPFPSKPHSSPIMPTIISTSISPSPPVIDPPVSSSARASSSSGPSSAGASTILSPRSFLHPPTPPTSVIITPTNPQHDSVFQNKFEDELERTTLISILAVASHLPEVQFGQFHGALATLRSEGPINCPFIVDFTNLKMPEVVFLPKLHSLVLDSSVGSHAFERFARVMGRISAQKGHLPSFQSSLVRAGKPPLSAEAFLDLNSINPVQELFVQWAARFSAFISLLKDLKDHQLFYPVTIAHFFQHASFGKSSHFRFTLDKDQYVHFLEEQRQLYIERMRPEMGVSFTIDSGIFQQFFEEQEIKAWELISQHASLLSPIQTILFLQWLSISLHLVVDRSSLPEPTICVSVPVTAHFHPVRLYQPTSD
ncbi:hypothetical protein Taro_029919 [Colocasia esculenta]|uniref:Uncharacterized protein n=1 Tax=Colocasia esculenta TaxID=4460 RepID=A0A843VSK0_COLES|nr:hypothetical protein [Colocasia esculenta]